MELLDAIKDRRSIRRFKDRPVSMGLVREVLYAAIQNTLLRAHDLGLGSLWVGDVYYAYDAMRENFRKEKLSGAVSLGYSDG